MTEDRKAKYRIGDVVKLNAGGPEMSVFTINLKGDDTFAGSYKCQWFAGKKLDSGIFREDSLILVRGQGE